MPGYAEISIQGKVVNSNTGSPVDGASVYLNNTTYAATTNGEGRFTLTVTDIFTGDIIVSSAGYELLAYKLAVNDAYKKLYVFKLEVKEKKQDSLVIMNDATRQEWLGIFKANFLGITEEAENCRIMNLDAVYFIAGNNTVYAYADTSLIVTNKLLGYTIAFDLIEFYFDLNKIKAWCLGYTRYEEMDGSKKYIKRRKQNYYGSTLHFFRSLINRELETEGFSMFEVKNSAANSMPGGEAVSVIPIRPVNILFIDSISNEYYLQFSGQVMVQFVKSPGKKHNYLTNDLDQRGNNDFGFNAYINLVTDKAELDARGFIRNSLEISYSGFWNYEKLANQLPFNYTPE
jgi:CarboxypepD_reg-like domain